MDTLKGSPRYATCLAFSRDSRYLAAGGDKTVLLWDLRHRRLAWRRNFTFCCPGQFLAYSPNGRWLVTGGRRGSAMILNAGNGAVAMQWAAHDTNGVMAAAFSPDGHRLVTSGFRPGIRLWDFDRLIASRSRPRRH